VRALLLVRAALNLLAGIYFLAAVSSDAAQNFRESATYLVADGLVALLMAGTLYRMPRPTRVKALAGADALARLALGLWFLLVPHLQSTVTARVFVLVMLFTVAVVLGFIGIWVALRVRSASAWPIVVASVALVVYVGALFVVFPDAARMRMLLGVYVLTFSAALFAAGLRLR
jgi:hypothetical protein